MALSKDFYAQKLRVRVFSTRGEMGACAGQEAAQTLRKLLKEKDEVNVMFAAAPSQNETLAALCAESGIDWTRVRAFHMDEYIGLDAAHPAGFGNFLCRAIFDRLPFRAVHLLDGGAKDPEAAALAYGALLAAHPIDICLLGIGENGHIAFNDPPEARFDDTRAVRAAALALACREQQVNDGCFSSLEEVPQRALTVTIPQLLKAQYLFCSVPAATKAQAVRQMLSGPVSEACPASILTTHPRAWMYVDLEAGNYLL